MSWKATGYVKDLCDNLTITEKFTLLVLADYHSTDERASWPALDTLAKDCLMNKRSLRRILTRLEEKQFVVRTSGCGRGNVSGYKIVGVDIAKRDTVSPFISVKGDKKGTEKGTLEVIKGDPAGTPIRKEPKENLEQENMLLPIEIPKVEDDPIPKVFAYFCERAEKSSAYRLTDKRHAMAARRWAEEVKVEKANGTVDIHAAVSKKFRHVINEICASQWHREHGHVEWKQLFETEEKFTTWLDRFESDFARKQETDNYRRVVC
jgi:Helix-turn-helix domain